MSKRKLLYLTTAATLAIALSSLSTMACKKMTNISVNKSWFTEENSEFFSFVFNDYNNKIAELIKEINEKLALTNNVEKKNELKSQIKQLNESYKKNIAVKFEPDNANIGKEMLKGNSDFGVLTTTLFNSQNYKKDLTPIIQTLTRGFKFDLNNFQAKYQDGKNDQLINIAKTAEAEFLQKPYNLWEKNEYGWNGIIYEKFYANKNENVDYYRGLIMIQGTDLELKEIKEAWENKNWNKFRDFGIIIGNKGSGSKYIAQEALFKKHFNLEGNKFESFDKDRLKHGEKYISGKARDIAKGAYKKYHIVFDELGSFAYTFNEKHGKKTKYYTPEDANVKINFLTVTEAIKYNVFVTSNKTFNKTQRDLLAKSFFEIWKNGKDSYGPSVGFNGYKIITNFEKEVIEPYENLFKI